MAAKKQRRIDPPENSDPPTPGSLQVVEPKDEVVRAALKPEDMKAMIREYKELQATLDRAMPDQIMKIKGRPFRKKGYWRAIRTAFGLSVEEFKESPIVRGNTWGYNVTYRATAPNGKYADGDGSCMSSEKSQPTEHNVRAHAHTRGFNRAVSNLVGFGEVSAEEAEAESDENGEPVINDEQRRRLWTIKSNKKMDDLTLREILIRDPWHYESTKKIKVGDYDAICQAIEEHREPGE